MRWMLALMISALLAACSSKPSDGDVEEAVRIAYTSASPDLRYFDIVSVKRKNGYEGEGGAYVVEAVVTYKTITSYADFREKALASPAAARDRGAVEFQLRVLRDKDGDFPAGKQTESAERFSLVKTEKGWRVK